MLLKFTKMHGAGNDYIYINCFTQPWVATLPLSNLAIKLSDRHTGIGGDGIVLLEHSGVADAKMIMFNADGSEGNMCGNAIRCVGKYLYDNALLQKKDISIETRSGIKYLNLHLTENNVVDTVKVNMGQAEFSPNKIPVNINHKAIIAYPLTVGNTVYTVTCLSMGNPHCVVFTDNLQTIDIESVGKLFENHSIFPERVNTEFAVQLDATTFAMRVWERGSGETLACGTGACAVVAAALANKMVQTDREITVKLAGGDLKIYIDSKQNNTVYMTGQAKTVFEGEVEL